MDIHPMQLHMYPPNEIRDILRCEINSKIGSILENVEYRLDCEDLLIECQNNLYSEIRKCRNYKQLDTFIRKYYRMSLGDWIKSL
jgi:hypothetical protein